MSYKLEPGIWWLDTGQQIPYFNRCQLIITLISDVEEVHCKPRLHVCQPIRELTNRRLLHDAAVKLRDMLTAHAFLSTCQLRAKVDDVGESELPASWKQGNVKLVFKVFSQYFGYFAR